jgi:hypothetical protein
MSTIDEVVKLAQEAHGLGWSEGSDVSVQTKKSQAVSKAWQVSVKDRFSSRFEINHSLNDQGPAQKINLVDLIDRVAYEMKVSANNVHMEIYRDVFKALVYNERNPTNPLRTLVFIAPVDGVRKLGESFPKDVQAIAGKLGLKLELRGLK